MSKLAYLFPGQGAQYAGMAGELLSRGIGAELLEEASGLLGIDMRRIIFEDPERLNQTEYTQPALITAQAAILNNLAQAGLKPDMCAGLSLGEYTAMLACGVMEFPDLIKAVRKRGLLMAEAEQGNGAMAAILGLPAEIVESVCREVTEEMTKGTCQSMTAESSEHAPILAGVYPANYNCPGQIVISGSKEAVSAASERLIGAGAKRAVPLKVSGAFHSPFLKQAGESFYHYLQEVPVQVPKIPYLANLTAEYVTADSDIRRILGEQIDSPVKWQQTIEKMIRDGAEIFLEIGPGRTLAGFLRQIDRSIPVYHVETPEEVDAAVKLLADRKA